MSRTNWQSRKCLTCGRDHAAHQFTPHAFVFSHLRMVNASGATVPVCRVCCLAEAVPAHRCEPKRLRDRLAEAADFERLARWGTPGHLEPWEN